MNITIEDLPGIDQYKDAIARLVESGDITIAEIGYCFECKQERQVLDVHIGRPQPPICPECLLKNSMALADVRRTLTGRT